MVTQVLSLYLLASLHCCCLRIHPGTGRSHPGSAKILLWCLQFTAHDGRRKEWRRIKNKQRTGDFLGLPLKCEGHLLLWGELGCGHRDRIGWTGEVTWQTNMGQRALGIREQKVPLVLSCLPGVQSPQSLLSPTRDRFSFSHLPLLTSSSKLASRKHNRLQRCSRAWNEDDLFHFYVELFASSLFWMSHCRIIFFLALSLPPVDYHHFIEIHQSTLFPPNQKQSNHVVEVKLLFGELDKMFIVLK